MKMEQTQFGIIDGDTYYKNCKPIHFFYKYQGFAISYTELLHLKEKEVKFVIINYDGKNNIIAYKSNLNDWFLSNKKYVFENNDLQKILSIKEMKEINRKNKNGKP